MDNPEKLAQMLQQQQAMKFLQSIQGMQGAGAMSEMDRMQMAQGAMQPQDAMQGQMPVQQPQGDYGMPMPQQSYSATMPTNPPQMDRRGMLQGAVNSLGAQGMGQGMAQRGARMINPEMMRKNDSISNYLRVAGGQMSNIPVPQGVPEGFLNPQQTYQSGINMTPLMLGANIPIGQGSLQANVMGTNVNAPNFSKTGVNQIGLGYSYPVGGGTLTGTVNKPMQGSGVDAMLQYSKQF